MTPLELILISIIFVGLYVTWCLYYGFTSTEFGTWQRTASKPGLAIFTVLVVLPVLWVKTDNTVAEILGGDSGVHQ